MEGRKKSSGIRLIECRGQGTEKLGAQLKCRGGRRVRAREQEGKIEGHAQRGGVWNLTPQSNSVGGDEAQL